MLTTCQEMPSQHLSSDPWPAFPPIHALRVMPYGMGYPFGQWESAVLLVSSPSSLCTPRLLTGRE